MKKSRLSVLGLSATVPGHRHQHQDQQHGYLEVA